MSLTFYNQSAFDYERSLHRNLIALNPDGSRLEPEMQQELDFTIWKLHQDRQPDSYDSLGLRGSTVYALNEAIAEFHFPAEGLTDKPKQALIQQLYKFVDCLDDDQFDLIEQVVDLAYFLHHNEVVYNYC